MTEFIDGHRWPRRATSPEDARSRPETPTTPAPDQQDGAGALPEALRDFLHLPDVWVRPDEQQRAVALLMPPYLAKRLAALCPDPLQVLLAAQLAEAALLDDEDQARDRELMRGGL